MDALQYAKDLIAFDSVSRQSNASVSDYVERRLKEQGFDTERIEYDDHNGVRKVNVIAKKGKGTGGLAYFGHTDVVPADDWRFAEHGPFSPTVKDNKLFGRGSCDMKGSIACMLSAASSFRASDLRQPLYFTCTADEEVGYVGAREVAKRSQLYKEMLDSDTRGIIGEPTRLQVVYAHKGTFGFRAISEGQAAHSSTRQGKNANLAMIPFLVEMKAIHDETESDPRWQNSEFDPPTLSWNIGINDHTHAINIKPPQSICTVYFRPMPGQDPQIWIDRSRAAAEKHGLKFEILHTGNPFYTDPHSDFVQTMLKLTGNRTATTVAYGTDGGVFGEMKHLVVFGPGDIAQAHTWDEWIDLDQLRRGTELYARLIQRWCLESDN